ncbi:protein FANTASTIC FOUR 3-like [Momordica charantia]|uniref:Protein FANTASTIC FOUR 3-like n=1 Tax=Momordica charantia TaxID=3673 RepID=A0A6J1DB14_MOMCH|nr:protein FANTASTIC FOUR 3-like [Momordica charantia]
MSSSIYQGLQSCLTEPHVLRLKLTPSKSNSSRPAAAAAEDEDSELSAAHCDAQIETHLEMGENSAASSAPAADMTAAEGGGNGGGGWSCLQALSGVYVDPPTKQNSPTTLSRRSLEMCTESLGSETGSDGSETSGDERMSLLLLDETEVSPMASDETPQPRFSRHSKLRATKKLARPNYPPLLSSMSGPMGVKVKPYREEGRLVLKAESLPSVKPCLLVERGDGRLRLRLANDHCIVEEEEEGKEENNIGKLGMGRRCKCKEGEGGRKGLLNWKPFLVST